MSDPSKFKDDEIREHLRQTQGRRKNLDYDRVKLMRELKALAERGSKGNSRRSCLRPESVATPRSGVRLSLLF
jgi:hypothetical protein